MKIFTLGTSTREQNEFLALLLEYEIECVLDVRAFPSSRFLHFKKELLESFLEEKGIKYIYLGRELGGYRKGGYKEYTKTELFKEGIKKICGYAKEARCAVICCERFPWRCHRRYIADSLSSLGYDVVHIIDKGKTWRAKDACKAAS